MSFARPDRAYLVQHLDFGVIVDTELTNLDPKSLINYIIDGGQIGDSLEFL